MNKKIKIKNITAREILDSRGVPTIEAELITAGGTTVTAGIPSGKSTGKHEVFEVRDGNKRRYRGMGVQKAIHTIEHTIFPRLKNKSFSSSASIDTVLCSLDKTKQKTKLGGNALLAVSLVGAKACAQENGVPLYQYLNGIYKMPKLNSIPVPMMNIFNGGKHADTNLDIQELMVVPQRKKLVSERIRMGTEIFYALGDVLLQSGFDTDTGDEGGYAPDIHATTEAIRMLLIAAKEAGYIPGRDVMLAFDIGGNTLYDKGMKQYRFALDAALYTSSQMVAVYEVWAEQFPLMAIEDPLAEDDWRGWTVLTERLGNDVMIVGDDLFVSTKDRLQKGIRTKAANAIIIKPNQVGTISETFQTISYAQKNNIDIIVSHRSGETNDDSIVDIAVAAQASHIKCGAPNRGERVAKYNRLTAIEDEMIHRGSL